MTLTLDEIFDNLTLPKPLRAYAEELTVLKWSLSAALKANGSFKIGDVEYVPQEPDYIQCKVALSTVADSLDYTLPEVALRKVWEEAFDMFVNDKPETDDLGHYVRAAYEELVRDGVL